MIRKISDQAYADAASVKAGPHHSSIAKMTRLEALTDPEQWAFTWRAYRRKVKSKNR